MLKDKCMHFLHINCEDPNKVILLEDLDQTKYIHFYLLFLETNFVFLELTAECVSKNASDSSTKVCPEPVLLYSDGTFANNYVLEDPNPLFIYVCTKVSICVYLSFENKVNAFLYMFYFDQCLLVLVVYS